MIKIETINELLDYVETEEKAYELIEYIKKLQQENKQLKEQLEYLRSNEYLNQVKWERNFNEELVKDLQQKIDKAIKYIKLATDDITEYLDIKEIKELLKILGGKENARKR